MKNASLLALIFATAAIAQVTPPNAPPPPGHDVRHHPPKPCITTDATGKPSCEPEKTETKTLALPTIPTVTEVEYYKKQAALFAAKSSLQNTPQFKELDLAEQNFQNIVKKISLICGEHNLVSQDDKGDPICITPPKPAVHPPAPPAKVEEKK